MATLTELIKESLEGKLSDQIRASLEAEDNEMNEAAIDFDFSNPIDKSSCSSFNSCLKKAIKHSLSKVTIIDKSLDRFSYIDKDISKRPNGVYVYVSPTEFNHNEDFNPEYSESYLYTGIIIVAKNSENIIITCKISIYFIIWDNSPNKKKLKLYNDNFGGVELIYDVLPPKYKPYDIVQKLPYKHLNNYMSVIAFTDDNNSTKLEKGFVEIIKCINQIANDVSAASLEISQKVTDDITKIGVTKLKNSKSDVNQAMGKILKKYETFKIMKCYY